MGAAALLTILATAALPRDDPAGSRPQDRRSFVLPAESEFAALPGVPATHRWVGVLDGAAYRIEVPASGWNGQLLMWAHGYFGEDPNLRVRDPLIRRHLIERGYAWAASSFSKNGYDVRAGVEDTNQLALAFTAIARAHQLPLAEPTRILIAGASMGGHIAAAAVERATLADERHRVRYAGALPMCGVLGDTELANYFAAYHLAAVQLAGRPARSYPIENWSGLRSAVQEALWSSFPAQLTAAGERLKAIDMNLSGGARPLFAEGYADPVLLEMLWSTGGRDGTLNGVLTGNVADTRGIIYRFDGTGPESAQERAFNAGIARAAPVAGVNERRPGGLRWVPLLAGEFDVPVLTLHTLGDIYVPIRMEQIYRQRAATHGRAWLLVQRLIRDVGHCAFTEAEADEAFDALTAWVAGGARPAGDDVGPAAIAAPRAGCRFTRNVAGEADHTDLDKRRAAQAHYAPCAP